MRCLVGNIEKVRFFFGNSKKNSNFASQFVFTKQDRCIWRGICPNILHHKWKVLIDFIR